MIMENIVAQLEKNANIFESLLRPIQHSQYHWRPSPEKWSLLEITCHLLDEEVYDFRTRVKHALETPNKPLEPIDPEGWVTSRNYREKDFQTTLDAFLNERNLSVQWLGQQTKVNWSSALEHPELGKLSAELFLRNWLAHDYLHIRQILRYHFESLKNASEIDLNYAGNW